MIYSSECCRFRFTTLLPSPSLDLSRRKGSAPALNWPNSENYAAVPQQAQAQVCYARFSVLLQTLYDPAHHSLALNEGTALDGKRIKRRIMIAIIPTVISWVQRLVFMTMQKTVIGEQHIRQLKQDGRLWILSVWHTNVLCTPLIERFRSQGVLVSQSFDGELIARVVQKFGHRAIRGSSTRGGKEALKVMIECAQGGTSIAFTPDGPNGPPEKVKPGLIIAAQKTGLPVVPIYYDASPSWVSEKSWDKHIIPKPFCHMVIAYGEPVTVPPAEEADSMERGIALVEAAMANTKAACQTRLAQGRGK